MQKACEFEEMNGPFCNKKVKDMLKKMEPKEEKEKSNENPIWKGLEKFKDL